MIKRQTVSQFCCHGVGCPSSAGWIRLVVVRLSSSSSRGWCWHFTLIQCSVRRQFCKQKTKQICFTNSGGFRGGTGEGVEGSLTPPLTGSAFYNQVKIWKKNALYTHKTNFRWRRHSPSPMGRGHRSPIPKFGIGHCLQKAYWDSRTTMLNWHWIQQGNQPVVGWKICALTNFCWNVNS